MICIPLGVMWGDFEHLFHYVFHSGLETDYPLYNTKDGTHDAYEQESHDLECYTDAWRRALEICTAHVLGGVTVCPPICLFTHTRCQDSAG